MHAPIPPTGPHICIHVHMYRYSLYTHIGLYKLDSSSTIRDVPAASRISYSSFAQILEHGAIHNNHTVLSKSNPGLHGHARLRDRLGLVLASPREGTQTKWFHARSFNNNQSHTMGKIFIGSEMKIELVYKKDANLTLYATNCESSNIRSHAPWLEECHVTARDCNKALILFCIMTHSCLQGGNFTFWKRTTIAACIVQFSHG